MSSEVQVINGLGSNVMTKKYDGNISERLDVSRLPAGIYFLNVKGNNFNFARRFIVIR
ncbi:MAG: T9SS type A sorting domain-containing protein [Saprospiraceae bacterium]|nr:T9SS type A sorting domain-containing protein [Saprospiraceae bacterium]